jgi:hypothetical protein
MPANPKKASDAALKAERKREADLFAEGFIEPWDLTRPPRKRRKRKPSLAKIIRAARKNGATGVILPDGTRLDLGTAPEPTDAGNPWLADLKKAANQ